MAKESPAAITYEFIKDCLPKRDLNMLNDAITNRAVWNIGTSNFAVSRMDKHYRKIAEKILSEIDDFTERNGPVTFPEKEVE